VTVGDYDGRCASRGARAGNRPPWRELSDLQLEVLWIVRARAVALSPVTALAVVRRFPSGLRSKMRDRIDSLVRRGLLVVSGPGYAVSPEGTKILRSELASYEEAAA
jgi:hypothetical protein